LTRRNFVLTLAAAPRPSNAPGRLLVPVHRIADSRARCTQQQHRQFWSLVWPEAVRNFSQGGIGLQVSDGPGEVRRSPGDTPIFTGLRPGVLNLVLTDHIPTKWDSGRASAGVTTIHDGYHICLIALQYAHGDQVPFVSVNTCVHEILHALLQDVFVNHPKWYQAGGREFRTDWFATRLWLFHDGAAIQKSARTYLDRLRSTSANSS
jgi:hypothetical protein